MIILRTISWLSIENLLSIENRLEILKRLSINRALNQTKASRNSSLRALFSWNQLKREVNFISARRTSENVYHFNQTLCLISTCNVNIYIYIFIFIFLFYFRLHRPYLNYFYKNIFSEISQRILKLFLYLCTVKQKYIFVWSH